MILLTQHYDRKNLVLTEKGVKETKQSYEAIKSHVNGNTIALCSNQPRARQAAELNAENQEIQSHRELCGLKPASDFRWLADKLKVLETRYEVCLVYTHKDFLKRFPESYTEDYERILDESATPRIVIFDTDRLWEPSSRPHSLEGTPTAFGNALGEIRYSEYIVGKIKLGKPFTEEQERYLSRLRLSKKALDLQERYPKSRNGELEHEIRRLASLIEKHEND